MLITILIFVELEENRFHAIKLINVNQYLEDKMMNLDDKIAKISTNRIQLRVNISLAFLIHSFK